MKKLIYSFFFLLTFVSANAQSIDYLKDNQNFYVLSPNGRYSAGAIESFPAFFYDVVEGKFSYNEPEWDRG